MKAKEKRKPRAYKIADSSYLKAMKKAKKEKTPLASMIEEIVTAYGNGGFTLSFIKPLTKKNKINHE